MIDQVRLRSATRADTATIAHLWVDTFPDKFGPILGDKAEPILYDWLRLSESYLSTTTVAEVSGVVGGFIALKSPSSETPNNGRWFWHALQLHQSVGQAAWSFFKMSLLDSRRPVQNDEVYIEMLGVTPSWRGCGLASRLIRHAEDVAQRETVKKLSLNVVCDNATAIEVYHKLGFEMKRRMQSPGLTLLTGHQGYYEMVKYL
ncbi:MAG: GNAT family N-acetyltransferase [Anaerolineae bacterium]|nr:GNAT family N-acetyltransferase [Anaerolineae bacterium]